MMKKWNFGKTLMISSVAVMLSAALQLQTSQVEAQAAENYEHKLFFASDYQGDPPAENLDAITKVIEEEGITPELAVWCGDYTNLAGWVEAEDARAEIKTNVAHIKNTMTKIWPDLEYICLQGNHDNTSLINDGTLTKTGPIEYDDYIIYVINMDDFPWAQGVTNDFSSASANKTTVKKTASDLKTYLGGLIEEGCEKPVLISTHVPLHWSARTTNWSADWQDNLYAETIFTVLNEAATELDIIYLFGHNHSGDFDQYLGGSVNYLAVGDVMRVPDGTIGKENYKNEVINFTYMNAGYMGYTNKNLDPAISTASILTIEEDTITIEKYSGEGIYEPATEVIVRNQPEDANSQIVTMELEERRIGDEEEFVLSSGNVTPVSYSWSAEGSAVITSENDQKEVVVAYEKAGQASIRCEITYEDIEGNSGTLTKEYEVTVYPAIDQSELEKGVLTTETGSTDSGAKWTSYRWDKKVYIDKSEVSGLTSCTYEYLNDNGEWETVPDINKNESTGTGVVTYFDGFYTDGLKVITDTAEVAEWKISGDDSNVELLADFDFDDEENGFKGGLAVAEGEYTLDDGAIYLDAENTNWLNVTKGDGSSLLTGVGEFTISMDLKRANTDANWAFYAAPHPYAQTSKSEHYMGILINAGITVECYNSLGIDRPDQAYIRAVNSDWMHLDVVFTDSATDIYIDGRLASHKLNTVANSKLLGDDSVLWIGRAAWGAGEYFTGWIDNYQITARALSADEIAENQRVHKNVVAYFDFDDMTGFSSDGIVVSGNYSLVNRDGGKAISLNGNGQYLSLSALAGNSVLTGYDEFTIAFDVKPDTSGDTNWMFYASSLTGDQVYLQEKYLGVITDSSNTLKLERYNNTGSRPAVIETGLASGWHHIAVVYTDKESILYVDGVEEARQSSSYTLDSILGNNSIFYIGKANWVGGEYFKGQIDNWAVAGYALSEEQIEDLAAGNRIENEPIVVEPELPYEDVAGADWFYDAVAYTFAEGLMTGMDATHFGPYGFLSRAQFALILYRMEGEPIVQTDKSFGDIVGNEWYGPSVLWAAENGIVTGYQSGNFGPADMITREQMAVMMYRYANYLKEDTSEKADFGAFKDAANVSSFASDAMGWAVGNGIITGKESGTMLDPQGNTARAEAAVIIQRFMK